MTPGPRIPPPPLELATSTEQAMVDGIVSALDTRSLVPFTDSVLHKAWVVVPFAEGQVCGRLAEAMSIGFKQANVGVVFGYLLDYTLDVARYYRIPTSQQAFEQFSREFFYLASLVVGGGMLLYMPYGEFSVMAGSPNMLEQITRMTVQEIWTAFEEEVARERDADERDVLMRVARDCREYSSPSPV